MIRIVNGQRVEPRLGSPAEFPIGVPGVFETLFWHKREAVFWSDHWRRFESGCQHFKFAPPVNAETVLGHLEELAELNRIETGVARFAAWRAGERSGWQVDLSPPRPHMRSAQYRVRLGPAIPVPGDEFAYKHLSRMPWIGALRDARESGYDEVLLCDPGRRVVEGGAANVFFVRNGALETPALSVRPLAGVMRARVLEHARSAGITVSEGQYTVEALHTASEIWFTNSLVGIRPVVEVSGVGAHTWAEPGDCRRPVLTRFRESWSKVYGWDPMIVVKGA